MDIRHIGVKGMRWGVRKKRSSSSSSTTQIQRVSSDHAKSRDLSRKKLSELSNSELSALATRFELEKRVQSVVPSKREFGKKLFDNALKQYSNKVATDLVNVAATKTVTALMNKAVKS